MIRFIDALLAEFDHEVAVTRRLLDCVPEDKAAWRPAEKCRSLGELCLHLATLPAWTARTLRQAGVDLQASDDWLTTPDWESKEGTLRRFDRETAAARAALASASEAELVAIWTLKHNGHPVCSMPRAAVLRAWVFNHAVHHRGQLTVYLRMCGVALPPIYGPTADAREIRNNDG